MQEEDPTAVDPDEALDEERPAKPVDIPEHDVEAPTDQEENEAEEPTPLEPSEAAADDTVDDEELDVGESFA